MQGSNGEGNGNPLQCSCLENPRDGGAWWAAVYGVAQSQTQLKRLSSSSSSSGDVDVENRLMDEGWGEEGEAEIYGDSSMEAYTLTYVKEPVGIFCVIWGTQLGFCNNLEGWEREGGGREVQEGGDICILMANSS